MHCCCPAGLSKTPMLICLSGRCASGNISTTFPAKTLCMIMNRLRSRGLAWRSFQYNLISWIQTVEKPASATFKALRLQASWSGFEDLRAESEPAGGGQGWWIWLTFYCSNASFFLFRVDLVDLHRFGHGLSRSFFIATKSIRFVFGAARQAERSLFMAGIGRIRSLRCHAKCSI